MTTDVTLRQWLVRCGLPRADAFALACAVLRVSKAWCIAHDDENVPTAQLLTLDTFAQRRKEGEPIAYIVGEKEFFGRMFACTPATLTPRPETELLIDQALRIGDTMDIAALRVLDLGTGTGCIAITLACERPEWHVRAVDVSVEALAVARQNALALNVATQVTFAQSDWFSALANETFDLIVSNPPYIRADDPHLGGDGVRHEPRIALTDNADGLSAYRTFAAQAQKYLRRNGVVLVEHGYDQAESIQAIFAAQPHWEGIVNHRDLAELPRATEFRYRPAAIAT